MSWTDAFINADKGDLSDGIQVAEMVSANSCKIGDLVLTAEDLLFNENLTVKVASKVAGQCPEGGSLQDTSTYINPLQAGDKVAVYKVKGSDPNDYTSTLYLVLGKLVKL